MRVDIVEFCLSHIETHTIDFYQSTSIPHWTHL